MKFFSAVTWIAIGSVSLSLKSAAPALFTVPTHAGDYNEAIKSDGRIRKFNLHVPPGVQSGAPLSLVLAFHGSSASASVIERETAFNPRADSINAVVAYPEGLHRGWNIGECCRYSFMKGIDDIEFSMDIIHTLQRSMNISRDRIYATGYSDGGSLAYLIACRHSDEIAAVAAVGSTLYDPLPKCRGPVSILNIHATGDRNVPFAGKRGSVAATDRGEHTEHSAADVVNFWLDNNQCARIPVRSITGKVKRESYTCPRAEVLFFSIEGGEHGWPGGGRGWILSPIPPKDVAASDSILSFFLGHRAQRSATR